MIDKKNFLKSFLIGTSCLLMTSAHAGPFGLEKGMGLERLKHFGGFARTDRAGWYSVAEVPLSHPEFERYDLLIDPSLGLCKIVATGKTIRSDLAGVALKSRLQGIESTLNQRYGRSSSSFDILKYPTVWKNPADWMMGLYSGARARGAFWSDGSALNKFKLQAIQLEARAISPSSGWIFLIYEFQGADVCADAAYARMSEAL